MPIERLRFRRMRVLGAFPAVLDDQTFKFSWGSMRPDPPNMFMLHRSVSPKEGYTRGILSTPASDVHEQLKRNGTAIKMQSINKRNITRQSQQFSFTKTSIKS